MLSCFRLLTMLPGLKLHKLFLAYVADGSMKLDFKNLAGYVNLTAADCKVYVREGGKDISFKKSVIIQVVFHRVCPERVPQ